MLRGGFFPYFCISCLRYHFKKTEFELKFTQKSDNQLFKYSSLRELTETSKVKIMRRILLTLIVLAFVSAGLVAQDFTVSPSPVSVTGDPDAALVEAPSKVTNNTNNVLNLRWERVVEDIPVEWQTLVCDNILCWGPTKSVSDFTLEPNADGDMKPNFKPNGVEGTGVVHILIYDPLDSLNTVQEHVYTANINSVSVEEPTEVNFTIYPNPAKNFVVLPENSKIKKAILYNITGQQVKIFDLVANTRRFDVADVMRGTYLLQFIDETGAILHTTRLTKR